MKKFSLTFVFFISISILAFSQYEREKISLRYVKGYNGFEIGAGITKFSKYYSISSQHFFKDKYFLRPSVSYEFGRIELTDYRELSLIVGINRNIINYQDILFINIGIGPALQNQTTNNELLDLKDEFFLLGVAGNINLELYLTKHIALNGNLTEIYSFNDKFGKFRYLLGAGLKISLN